MIPPIADASDDPTSQIPWPAARGVRQPGQTSESSTENSTLAAADGVNASPTKSDTTPGRRRLSTWDLITLSISMAGAQIAWTVELGWVAGPCRLREC